MPKTTVQQITQIFRQISETQTGLSTLLAKKKELESAISKKQKQLESLQVSFNEACGEGKVYCPSCRIIVEKEALISETHDQVREFFCPNCESLIDSSIIS